MGKVKPRIPSGKFVLLNRVNANGESSIQLRFHMDGYVKRSTGISIPPTAWDENKCCVKPSYPDSALINAKLQNLKCEIDNKLLAYEGEMNLTVLNFILNTSLNVARMTLRLPFPLTMHVARHSFAVMCINKGMDVFMLSKILGHSTIQSTQKTYAQFLRETVEQETQFIRDL